MRGVVRRFRSRRGFTLVAMTGGLAMLLAFAALAIDLASLRSARSEAQRAADAIALAGASAFRDLPETDPNRVEQARIRALNIARQNKVRLDTINIENMIVVESPESFGPVTVVTTEQVMLNIIPNVDSQKVRAWVSHEGIPTFFGGMIGVRWGHVKAMATAWASNEGPQVDCLKPFVIPDIWWESDKTEEDVDDDNYMDPIPTSPGNNQVGESWKYEPASVGGEDYYLPYDPSVPNDPLHPQTGYGSGLRDGVGYTGDVGLPMLIKPQTGDGNAQSAPSRMGNAFWLLDFDPNANVRQEIEGECATARIGEPVPYESGGQTGGTKHGVKTLIEADPGATWNPSTRQVENSNQADWTKSPRVIIIGLISPEYWISGSENGNTKPDEGSVFTNFARMFLQDMDKNDNIQAIFLGHAPGSPGGEVAGPLVKVLQLIE